MMNRISAILLVCIWIGGCASPKLSPPFAEGRLIQRAYVELIGNRHQVDAMKSEASRRGWIVDCEGRIQGYSTLRIIFPAGTTEESINANFGVAAFFAEPLPGWLKVQFVYKGKRRTKGACASL